MCASVQAMGDVSSGQAFEHRALFYRGEADFVRGVVGFVREGRERDDAAVLLALTGRRLALCADALGDDARGVELLDMEQLGGNPARIIPEWRRFLHEHAGGRPVRGVGEPAWAGRRAVEYAETALHESLINVAFDGGPGWRLLCPYDLDALPASVTEEARRTHPAAEEGEVAAAGAPEYAGHPHARETFSAPLSPAPAVCDSVAFRGDDLAGLRSTVALLAQRAGLGRDAADEVVLAVHELAANSVEHAGGTGRLTTWVEPGAFVVQVEDPGWITDPLVGRDLMRDLEVHGRGVWMAHQLCDLVQVRSGEQGTTARIYSWL
jgi:anti-sigma regulatory factor (Ser/Thr protein kinase)